ncbi:MAG: EAL domain-containing protein, partial [Clostridia bacterium]|nr:EAL domain-containing protein [Clostridia bacterium]
KQLIDPDFHVRVLEVLEKYNVPAGQLQVEITEAAALVENKATSVNLGSLHRAGVNIAMDDFGVGHSSLLYLRTQPITTLKIDGSLSRDVQENPANLGIIATIYDLCQLLNVKTVVEYVDNQAQLEKLMDIGTFLIQGYLYSPPVSGSEIQKFARDLERSGMGEG